MFICSYFRPDSTGRVLLCDLDPITEDSTLKVKLSQSIILPPLYWHLPHTEDHYIHIYMYVDPDTSHSMKSTHSCEINVEYRPRTVYGCKYTFIYPQPYPLKHTHQSQVNRTTTLPLVLNVKYTFKIR